MQTHTSHEHKIIELIPAIFWTVNALKHSPRPAMPPLKNYQCAHLWQRQLLSVHALPVKVKGVWMPVDGQV